MQVCPSLLETHVHPTDSPGLFTQFLRFAGVGAAGFVIDLAVTLLCVPHIGPGLGRIAAIVVAVAATYGLNRCVTFRSADQRVAREFLRYALVSALGAGINFGGYALCLAAIAALGLPGTASASLSASVAAGSVLALGFNFCGARLFAFAR